MPRILYFAFDISEASQLRRIRTLLRLGHDVTTASFQRNNMTTKHTADWPNIDLGVVENQRLGWRILAVTAGILRMFWHRNTVRTADVYLARNFDLLIIAWLARGLFGAKDTPLIYECLDIHNLFCRKDIVGRFARWAEQRLLARVQLLVVSSQGFVDHYFRSVQGYDGPVSIIENKLWFDGPPVPRPQVKAKRSNDAPLTLGWVGSIRCAPSLALLLRTADIMGDGLKISIHGNIHRHALPDFDEEIGKRGNVTWFGPYDYPEGLAEAYSGCDLVWAQDLWQRGSNSDWLLPNRIYEASWFGCPSVAVADTETGRRVQRDNLGAVVDSPDAVVLSALLTRLSAAELAAMSARLLDMEDRAFQLLPEDVEAALSPVLAPDEPRAQHPQKGVI